MNIQLTRLRVKEGKSERVREWMKVLSDNLPACIETLEGEKMYVEAIFHEKNASGEYLYWFSIQGEGGIDIKDSTHEIDKIHRQFAEECLDRNHPNFKADIPLEVFMKAKGLNFEDLYK